MKFLVFLISMVAMATSFPAELEVEQSSPALSEGLALNRGKQIEDDSSTPEKLTPYQFEWNVDDEEGKNFYGHQESRKEDSGRVEGSYYNFLPDGRLMRVDYYVDGKSGFVPTITYEKDYTPTWGTKFYTRRR